MISHNSDILNHFERSIRSLPGITVHDVQVEKPDFTGKMVDMAMRIEVKGEPVYLIVEVKSYGHPRDVRAAAWQLRAYSRPQEATMVLPILVVPSLSARSKEFLRAERLGYWDTSESLYLELPRALYYIDRPRAATGERQFQQSYSSPTEIADKPQLRNPYRGASAQVLHALLVEPKRKWHVKDIAAVAGVSVATPYRVFNYLEQHLYVEKEGTGPDTLRSLRAPGQLLDAWASEHSLEEYQFRRFFYWAQSPTALRQEISNALSRSGAEYALTLSSGAELVAPFATRIEELSIIIREETAIDELAKELNMEPVESGENVTFLITKDRYPLMFLQSIKDSSVASLVQLYLDLSAWPRRGKEQAQHLRSQHLPY